MYTDHCYYERQILYWICCNELLCNLKSYLNSYLVDPASSHMLVSKIKPCMSKFKQK